MNAQHTPGPWTVTRESDAHPMTIQTAEGNAAYVRHMGRPDAEWIANARLIAAAPELLAALQECITDDKAQCIMTSDVAYMILRFRAINALARAAIAKATGGEA